MRFNIVLQKEKTGYSVYVPELPGCLSQGDTKKEALKNIGEAIELYLEDLSKKELEELRHNVSVVTTEVKLHA